MSMTSVNLAKTVDIVGRFAPSPTGYLHAGNLFAALMAWLFARKCKGSIILRLEDLDKERSHKRYCDAIMRDYEWMGLSWDRGPYYQHDRADIYEDAFKEIKEKCSVYPCFCSRADLRASSAPHQGEQRVYSRTCALLTEEERRLKARLRKPAWRLMVPSDDVSFRDALQGEFYQNLARDCGDFVIRRSDGSFAYQLAVVIDDAEQGVNQVVRGCDLMGSTPQQIYLQQILGFQHPQYAHIPLMVNQAHQRLSKRDGALSIEALKTRYGTPEAILGALAGKAGIVPTCEPLSLHELLEQFNPQKLVGVREIVWDGVMT